MSHIVRKNKIGDGCKLRGKNPSKFTNNLRFLHLAICNLFIEHSYNQLLYASVPYSACLYITGSVSSPEIYRNICITNDLAYVWRARQK